MKTRVGIEERAYENKSGHIEERGYDLLKNMKNKCDALQQKVP